MESITFKEFEAWCNERACDGWWDAITAMVCIDLIEKMRKVPVLQREKVWNEKYEKQVLEEIINPIEEEMEKTGVCETNQKKTLHSTENGQNTEKKSEKRILQSFINFLKFLIWKRN